MVQRFFKEKEKAFRVSVYKCTIIDVTDNNCISEDKLNALRCFNSIRYNTDG